MAKRTNEGNKEKEVVQNVNDDRLISQPKKCPECGSSNLVSNDEGLFCADCGLVINEQVIDLGPEWRAFDFEQKSRKTRIGPPTTSGMDDWRLETAPIVFIAWGGSTPFEDGLKNAQRRIGRRTQNASFDYALLEIDRMSCSLGLPMNIKEEISRLYRKAKEKNLIKGKSAESIVTALFYIVCRQYRIPRTLKEIIEFSKVTSQKEIFRRACSLLEKLNLRVQPASPVDYVPRFCSELDLKGEISAKAIEIINSAIKKGLLANSRDPRGIAAAAIYISAILNGEHRTQREVAEVVGVTEPTIRERYKELSEKLNLGVNLHTGSYAGRPKNNNNLDKK